jgi:hypothetical protein
VAAWAVTEATVAAWAVHPGWDSIPDGSIPATNPEDKGKKLEHYALSGSF